MNGNGPTLSKSYSSNTLIGRGAVLCFESSAVPKSLAMATEKGVILFNSEDEYRAHLFSELKTAITTGISSFDENLEPKVTAIDTRKLKEALQNASSLPLAKLDPDQKAMLFTARLVLQLREAVKASDWEAVENAANAIRTHSVHVLCETEMRNVVAVLMERVWLNDMRRALKENSLKGEVGNLDLDELDTQELEDLLEFADEHRFSSKPVKDLIVSGGLICDLRNAVLDDEWEQVQILLDEDGKEFCPWCGFASLIENVHARSNQQGEPYYPR